jgi:CRP-like cAMP-binding protein
MKAKANIEFLQNYPLFESLSEAEMEKLFQVSHLQTVPRNGLIYRKGQSSDKMFLLVKCTVKIGSHAEDNREVIKAILHPMALFGELGLVGQEKRQEFASALNEEVTFFAIRIADFQQLMQQNHELCMKVLSMIGQRLQRIERRLESLIFKDARTRIIEFLKESARRQGRKVGFETLLKHSLTQQDIANITGTSRQTVTSVLNELKKENLIYFNRRSILIRDMAKLC